MRRPRFRIRYRSRLSLQVSHSFAQPNCRWCARHFLLEQGDQWCRMGRYPHGDRHCNQLSRYQMVRRSRVSFPIVDVWSAAPCTAIRAAVPAIARATCKPRSPLVPHLWRTQGLCCLKILSRVAITLHLSKWRSRRADAFGRICLYRSVCIGLLAYMLAAV